MRRIIAILAVILIPFASTFGCFFPIGGKVWFPQYLAFLIFLFLCSSLAIWKFDKWISLFMLLCLSSVIYPGKMGTRAIFHLFCLFGAIYAIYGVSRFGENERKHISLAIASLVLFMGGYLIVQFFNLDLFFELKTDPTKDAMIGLVGAKDQIGSFFAITLPFAIQHFRIKRIPVILPFALLGLYVSKSSFAIAAAVIGMGFYFFFKSRKLFLKIAPIILIAGILYIYFVDKPQKVDFVTRGNVWKYAITSIAKGKMNVNFYGRDATAIAVPYLGFGFSNWSAFFPAVPQKNRNFNFATEKFAHAHNDFVEGFFEMGVPFVVIVLLFYFSLFIRFLKYRTDEALVYFSAFVIYSVNAMGNFLSYLAVSGMLLIFILGMIEGIFSERRKKLSFHIGIRAA